MSDRRGGGLGSVPPSVSGSLEASVTLDEVFAVVMAKRVPLAPELAGYLSLEIAEAAASGGEVDPKFVYIGDEGTVALVRLRRESTRESAREGARESAREAARGEGGEAEGSIRAILSKLLEASGSQTPALAAAARRTKMSGMASLVEELEAALIPVNRAAGRRALARLAREVKRVTLGVGRNASRPSSPSYAGSPSDAPPSRASRSFNDEPMTARRDVTADVLSSSQPSQPDVVLPARPSASAPVASAAQREPTPPPPPQMPVQALAPVRAEPDELPTIEMNREQLEAAQPSVHGVPERDAVDNLLDAFVVSSKGEEAVSRELKALVGLDPTPPPAGSEDVVFSPQPPAHGEHGADVESLLAMSEPAPPVARQSDRARRAQLVSPPTVINPVLANEPIRERMPAPSPMYASAVARHVDPTPSPPVPATTTSSSPSITEGSTSAPTGPSMRKISARSGSEFTPPRAPREGRFLTMAALIILGAGAAAIWTLKPAFFSGHSERADLTAGQPADRAQAPAVAMPRCKATLTVTDVPQNAEVLLRVGQAPADVERMPVGARLEFVATAEGFAPKRTVVPAGAPWDPGPDGKPRYEVAVQLDKSRARGGSAVDPWPAGEPGSEVGGKGAPGTVHIVSTPRGAELWLLAGIGPEAKIDQLKCGADIDVLVAGPTTLRKRLHIPSGDFKATASADGALGDPSVTVSANHGK